MCEVRVFGLLTQVAFLATLVVGVEALAAAAGESPTPGGSRAGGSSAGGGTLEPRPATPPGGGQSGGPGTSPDPIRAAPGPELTSFIGGPSACPLPADVWRELGTLIPADRLIAYQAAQTAALPATASEAGSTPAGVEIVDLGEKYRVIAGGRVRDYRNLGRDCAYRARVAAVFVALTVDPDALAVEPPPPVQAPPPPPPPPPEGTPVQAAEPVVEVEIGAVVDHGMGAELKATHVGGGLRVVIGRGPLALVTGGTFAGKVDTAFAGGTVREGRTPFDLGVRLRWQGDFFEPYVETGLGLALLSEQGRSYLAMNNSGSAVEIGAFGAAGIRLPARSLVAFFLSGRGEWVPSPVEITAWPAGGHAPSVWLGAMAGAALGF